MTVAHYKILSNARRLPARRVYATNLETIHRGGKHKSPRGSHRLEAFSFSGSLEYFLFQKVLQKSAALREGSFVIAT